MTFCCLLFSTQDHINSASCIIQSEINELKGYQNSADVCEIWPEISLDVGV